MADGINIPQINLGQIYGQAMQVQALKQRKEMQDMQRAGQEATMFVGAFGDAPTIEGGAIGSIRDKFNQTKEFLGRTGRLDTSNIPDATSDEEALQFYNRINGIASQFGGDQKAQWGSQQTFKDEEGNLFFGSMRKGQNGASAVLTPIGDAPQKPVGNVQMVGQYGLTADEQVAHAGAQAGASEAAKLEKQTRAAREKAFEEVLGKEGGKIYSSLQNAAREASAFLPKLVRLKDMAKAAETGAYAEAKMIAKKYLGMDVSSDETLNAELMGLAQDILNQQTGTKTDFDFQVAVKQAASLGKSPEANVALINALIARQEAAIKFGDMAQEALQRGGPQAVMGLRLGADPQGAPSQPPQAGGQGGMTPEQKARLEQLRAQQR